jgi:hypothetical protein
MITITESDDLVDICRDNVFKAVFTKDSPKSRGALSKLLSAVIGCEMTVVSITANEPPADSIRDRQVRFDLTCKGGGGELSNVEVSLNPDKCEPVRLEFYAGKLFTSQDIRGVDKTYHDLKDTYQIAILVNGRFFDDDDFLHKFEYYDKERGISLGGRTHVITLELSKLEYLVNKPVKEMSAAEKWGFYFRYLMDKDKLEKINEIMKEEEGIAMASEVLITISKDEVERARLLSEYKYEADTQSRIIYAKREARMERDLEILKLLDAGFTPEQIRERLKADNL